MQIFRNTNFNLNNLILIIFIVCIIILIILLVNFIFDNKNLDNLERIDISKDYIEFLNDTQVIHIDVSDKFDPDSIYAKAGVETVLKFKTENAVGCLSVVNIPSLKIYEKLPPFGEKEIKLTSQSSGTVLIVTCSTGQNVLRIRFI